MAKSRPIVRSFKKRFAREAVEHVRAGGHAVLWEEGGRARATLLFRAPEDPNTDFGAWAVYDFGRSRWDVHSRGPFKGLASVRVPRDCHWIVKRRAERDSIHPGPTRRIAFDCTGCASCCKDNEVILEEVDLARFRDAGRSDLLKYPLAKKRSDGKLVLTLLPSKRCRHLDREERCEIYDVRPNACSEFPIGSECCLYAREEELKSYDGLAPGA